LIGQAEDGCWLKLRHDDMWIDVIDKTYLPRSAKFNYYAFDLQHMRQRAQEKLAGSLDFWTHVYHPRLGDTVIDIGAGIGVDAITLSGLVGETGHVHSLEAHPWTFQALRKACELNRLANVIPSHLAVADGPGTLWINSLENDEENSVSKAATIEHATAVPSIDLDSFIMSKGIQRIALLKMNIEGAEGMAIRGMRRCIEKIDHISIACHDFRRDCGATRQPVIEFLKSKGFDIVERRDDPRPYVRDHVHGIKRRIA
jgi:FkbM family methyltransferase